MIKKSLLLKIFNSACMQRWNDKLRPIELTEIDKQAHKIMIAYFLGKQEGRAVNWVQIIEGGIYEYMLRSSLTDIKPPIFHIIKRRKREYSKLVKWAHDEWKPVFSNFEDRFHQGFIDYHEDTTPNINRDILDTAHLRATRWEYDILKQFNGMDYEQEEIEKRLKEDEEKCLGKGLKGLIALESEKHQENGEQPLTKLINLCGELRYQVRWAHIHRMPKTSVLGHLLFVAIITYLISLELSKEKRFCKQRLFNNYFTGLFHDLPEVLTRDIISPVKRRGIDKIVKKEEEKQMEKKIMKLLQPRCKEEMSLFTGILKENDGKVIDEFENVIYEGESYIICKKDIDDDHNKNVYKPRDGRIVKLADQLAAFIEGFVAIENGCSSGELQVAIHDIKSKYNLPAKVDRLSSSRAFDLMREIYYEF